MSKIGMLQQSANDLNTSRVEALALQLQAVRQDRLQSVQELTAALEPMTQALAALCQETRSTLAELDRRSLEMGERSQRQLETLGRNLLSALPPAQTVLCEADSTGPTQRRDERRRLAWALAPGVASAATTSMLVSACWLWLFPPSIQNVLDPQAVAQSLKPTLIQALKPSKAR